MSDQGPTVFSGRYELHRRIGKGGMAEVSLARDQLLDRPVAIKVLFPEFAVDPAFVERFRREATAAANLSHPNIVGVYDWGEAEGTYFIVMEYVNGRTLSQVLRADGPLHPDRAADVGADVAAALGFAHRNGVVHRDVKPGNVLVDQNGLVKVADFGIARAITSTSDDHLTQVGTVMGTATYFSPEQARGDAVDPRSDIYSLGCVLYELVCGRPPFSGDSPVAIAYKQVHESPVPPRQVNPSVPPALEAIILKCLAKNPVNRYPSAEDLRADLRRFREGNRILAEPVMAAPPRREPDATGVLGATNVVAATRATQVAHSPYEDDEYDHPRRSSGAFFAVLAVLLLLLGGMLFVLANVLNGGSKDDAGGDIPVARVIGETLEDATTTLQGLGFEVDPVTEANDEFEAGKVFAQDPVDGSKKPKGTVITLKVSSGGEEVPVPRVIGKSLDEAKQILEDLDFKVTSTEEDNDTVPEAQVFAQDPSDGSTLAKGGTVRLTVSSGGVAVPDVTDLTEATAKSRLSTAGFTTTSTQEFSDTVDAGRVIKTTPAANSKAPSGSRITIVVSKGPEAEEMVTVPNVVGLSSSAARATLEGKGFVVDEKEESGTILNDDKVTKQTPSGNKQAAKGSTVTITVAVFSGDGESPDTGGTD